MYIFHSSIFHTLLKFFHTFSLTRYILYSFQEVPITLPLLLTQKILFYWFKITYAFRGRQVDRGLRSRSRGRNSDRGTTFEIILFLCSRYGSMD